MSRRYAAVVPEFCLLGLPVIAYVVYYTITRKRGWWLRTGKQAKRDEFT